MKLLVIDGNSIVNRAFFGMHPLNNKEGFPTHAIFGFLNILRRMERELEPDGICVTFDRREPTFRHLAYEGYKAQRKGMPEELPRDAAPAGPPAAPPRGGGRPPGWPRS